MAMVVWLLVWSCNVPVVGKVRLSRVGESGISASLFSARDGTDAFDRSGSLRSWFWCRGRGRSGQVVRVLYATGLSREHGVMWREGQIGSRINISLGNTGARQSRQSDGSRY